MANLHVSEKSNASGYGLPEAFGFPLRSHTCTFIFMRHHVKKLLRSFGYDLSRVPANRFDVTADALSLLQSFGYAPRVIVDAGANMGDWTRMAFSIFPGATYHLIEPQLGCHASLRSLAQEYRATCTRSR